MSLIQWPDPKYVLTVEKCERIFGELKYKLTGRCQAAYVFGSAASGDVRAESDVDIIIVKDTETPFTQRAQEFADLLDVFPRLDILVYTEAEFEAKRNEANGLFNPKTTQLLRLI